MKTVIKYRETYRCALSLRGGCQIQNVWCDHWCGQKGGGYCPPQKDRFQAHNFSLNYSNVEGKRFKCDLVPLEVGDIVALVESEEAKTDRTHGPYKNRIA